MAAVWARAGGAFAIELPVALGAGVGDGRRTRVLLGALRDGAGLPGWVWLDHGCTAAGFAQALGPDLFEEPSLAWGDGVGGLWSNGITTFMFFHLSSLSISSVIKCHVSCAAPRRYAGVGCMTRMTVMTLSFPYVV